MKLIQRIGYYLGGFSIGLILLAFFLNGKKVSCDYGPEARVLKNINLKPKAYSNEVKKELNEWYIDTVLVNSTLRNGRVNFSKSDTRRTPCGLYCVENDYDNKLIEVYVENCDSLATIQRILLK